MKLKDIQAGMILEDRSEYAQKLIKAPYMLILRNNSNSISYLRSSDPTHFYVSDLLGGNVCFDTHSSLKYHARFLTLVR